MPGLAVVRRLAGWIAAACGLVLAPVLVIASVWYAYFAHFYVDGAVVDPATIAALRHTPSDQVLDEVASQDALLKYHRDFAGDPVELADQLLAGRFTFGPSGPVSFSKPFAPSDVPALPMKWQVWFHGFGAPQIYLQAYEKTMRREFLEAARDYILAWTEHESSLWKPEVLLWNDHCIAERAFVLINFWRHYRSSAIYTPQEARRVLRVATEAGAMLADDGLYVYRTNHGVMQNLALLQLRLAFPALPQFVDFGQHARRRLQRHMPQYLNGEGAVLEHSAGYQEFGVRLLGPILRALTLLELPYPATWAERYALAVDHYAMLRRSDGTLPRWGDTSGAPDPRGPLVTTTDVEGKAERLKVQAPWRPPAELRILPDAATATWWQDVGPGVASQTFTTWSYYPLFGHKLPDELAVFVWAAQTSWWTGLGLLDPDYHNPDPDNAWEWSNAPHVAGEKAAAPRRSKLLGYVQTDAMKAVDVERRTADGLVVRRQIVQVDEAWLILDNATDTQDRRLRTIWRTDTTVEATVSPDGTSTLVNGLGDALDVTFVGSPSVAPRAIAASIADDERLVPTAAFVVEQPSRSSWVVNFSILRERSARRATRPTVRTWRGADHWELSVPTANGETTIERDGADITVNRNKQNAQRASFKSPAVPSDAVARAQAAFEFNSRGYDGPVRELWPYRVRMSWFLAALYAVQLVASALLLYFRPVFALLVAGASAAAWTSIGLWLWLAYF